MARDAIEQIDLTLRLVESYPETFQLVSGPKDVKGVYESGRIACSIGIEGLHMAGNSIGIIRAFYRLGVRYVSVSVSMFGVWTNYIVHSYACLQ
jgi:membrane dipeptidase